MAKFSEIKKFTRDANYRVNVSWSYLIRHIDGLRESAATLGHGFEICPDFQRGRVWTESQKERYVEYILKGGKSSREIQWNCKGWMNGFDGPMELVDGLQRLTAVLDFLDNKVKAFGHYFNEYEDKLPWTDCDFIFFVNNLETREEVLQWYLDLNTGGTPHTDEEIEKVKALLKKEKASKK